MVNWSTVRLPKEMMDEVEKFLKTDKAKKLGFTSKTQFIVACVREYLEHRTK